MFLMEILRCLAGKFKFKRSMATNSTIIDSLVESAPELSGSELEENKDHLGRCLSAPFSLRPDCCELEQDPETLRELHAQMMFLWSRIGVVIERTFSDVEVQPGGEIKACNVNIQATDEILRILAQIKRQYACYMESLALEVLENFIRSTQAKREGARAMRLLYQGSKDVNPISKLRHYFQGLLIHSPCLVEFLRPSLLQANDNGVPAASLNVFNYVVLDSNALVERTPKRSKIYPKIVWYLEQIKVIHLSTLDDIERLSKGLEPIGLITENINGEPVVISQKSAEGKAIQRIRNPIPDDEWEISYKPGDTINISEIRNRLKQRVNG